eukprot:TRINITY_DN17039_c0_g1_i1.p1 TRINITY_DN17039_c0_g1~~TRINITY_DN17039_c0_g1_i1.p1  ORF type:complete len:153 (+),score=1.97 TRINITY_DN17039_c0_g1_i1:27-485(+)
MKMHNNNYLHKRNHFSLLPSTITKSLLLLCFYCFFFVCQADYNYTTILNEIPEFPNNQTIYFASVFCSNSSDNIAWFSRRFQGGIRVFHDHLYRTSSETLTIKGLEYKLKHIMLESNGDSELALNYWRKLLTIPNVFPIETFNPFFGLNLQT